MCKNTKRVLDLFWLETPFVWDSHSNVRHFNLEVVQHYLHVLRATAEPDPFRLFVKGRDQNPIGQNVQSSCAVRTLCLKFDVEVCHVTRSRKP